MMALLAGRRERPGRQMFLILGLAVGAAVISNALAGPTRRVAWRAPSLPAAQDPPREAGDLALQARFPAPADGAPVEMDGEAILELHHLGVRFVDARRTADFQAGHIRGARSMPLWEAGLEEKLQDLDASTRDPNDPLVIYCSGGSCRDSHDLAQKLWLMGFRNLRIYTGGWPQWHANGWPSATGPETGL